LTKPKLWSHEYFIDRVELWLKSEIAMYFYLHHERYPTDEEYKVYFEMWKLQAECNVVGNDLGIFND